MKILYTLALVLTTSCFFACNDSNSKTPITDTSQSLSLAQNDPIKRGEYLVKIMGCNDCHSAKRMGPQGPEVIPETMLAGYPMDRPIVKFDSKLIKEGFSQFYPDLTAAAGPWGISFASNLTPHETGLGNWTEDQFKIAIKNGKYKGMTNSRMLLPPMPWTTYAEMEDADIKSIFAYLKSLKPVKNIVPQPITPDKM
jgi:cytochrome c553